MVNIHFLNTGSGDCTIVHFPARVRKDGKEKEERIMMVDMNHNENHEEYEDIIEYYKENFTDNLGGIKPIFRFVCTHPHHDHICGIHKILKDNKIRIYNFWDLEHDFEPESFEGHPWHKSDWDKYLEIRKKSKDGMTIIHTHRDDTPRLYWNDEEDRISVLSPSLELIKDAHYLEDGTKRDPKDVDIDSISYALLVKVNNKKILLAGDGKDKTWQDIYENCKDKIKDVSILKAGHHGQQSAFHQESLKVMSPQFIIFSNSKEEDKKFGAKDDYSKSSPNSEIYRTWEKGTIVAHVSYDEDEAIEFTFSK